MAKAKKTLKNDPKLAKSIAALEEALGYEKKALAGGQFYFGGIAKAFEVALEYAWKHLRKLVLDQGLEAYGPKDVIRLAGRIDAISDVELWLDFIEDRNIAVHDYLGISPADYLKTVRAFLQEARKLLAG